MPEDKVTGAIKSAIADARESGVFEPADTDEVVGGDETTETETTTSDETVGEKVVANATTTDATVTDEKKTADAAVADALFNELKANGFKPRKGKKNEENHIPYPDVKRITTNREKKAVEAVAKALGLDAATLKFDGLETAAGEKLKSYTELETRAQEFNKAEDIMVNEPEKYIRILAKVFPDKYGRLLSVLDGTTETKVVDPNEDILKAMPEMDVEFDLPDGSKAKTYSAKALQTMFIKAVELGAQRGEKSAEKVVKPIQEERAAAEKDAANDRQYKAELAEARTWTGFDEHFDKILAALAADTAEATRTRTVPKLRSLHDAYIKVVPALLQDKGVEYEQALRAKWLEEQKKVPTSTSVSSESAGKVVTVSDDPVSDAIRTAIRKLKG